MTDPIAAYNARLSSQWDDLIAEEQKLAERRQRLETATAHWVEHLEAMGLPIPAFGTTPDKQTAPHKEYDPFTRVVKIAKPRMGEKRRVVLLEIARATRAEMPLTSKEVIDRTGQEFGLVMNVLTQDRKRGILKSTDGFTATRSGRGHHYMMTEKGFELLAQLGLDKEI